jgi:hypothetical protein
LGITGINDRKHRDITPLEWQVQLWHRCLSASKDKILKKCKNTHN